MNYQSNDFKFIQEKSNVRPEDEPKLLHFYAEMDTPSRVEIMQESYKIFRMLSSDKSISKNQFSSLQYASLLSSIKSKYKFDPDQVIDLKTIAKLERKKEKKETRIHKLIRVKYYPEIKKLRSNGKSFQYICDYLKEAHKIKISHTYLIKIWCKEMNEL
jgi:hypothetical protein